MGRDALNGSAPRGDPGYLAFAELLQTLARLEGERVVVRVLSPSTLVPIVDWNGVLGRAQAIDEFHWRIGSQAHGLVLSSQEFVQAGYVVEPDAAEDILFIDQSDVTIEIAGTAIRPLVRRRPRAGRPRAARRRRSQAAV